MLTQHVRVRNITGRPLQLQDYQLPGGYENLQRDEETSLRREVYGRIIRRHSRNLLNLDSPSLPGEPLPEPNKPPTRNARGKPKPSERALGITQRGELG